METLVGNNFSKRTILVMQLAGQRPHIVRPGKSEPPSTRTEALRPPERRASGTEPGSSALSAPSLYERSLDWRVGSFQVSMLEIDLGISLHQPRLIRLDEPDLRCVRTEQSGPRIA
jgi:hypothetical protein